MTRCMESVGAGASGALLLLLCAAAAGWAPGCGPTERRDPVYFSTRDWQYKGSDGYVLRSDHYVIYSTYTRAPFVFALPGFLETCHEAYAALLPSPRSVDGPLETYLFKSRWEWERFTEAFAPVRAATYKHIRRGGYATRGVTVSQYSRQASTLSTLAHEGLHQYLEVTDRHRIPAWLNEGLACYFEAFDLVDDRPVFRPERNTLRRPVLREAVAGGSLIPLREVLTTHAGEVIHGRSKTMQRTYAQWWSLVVFLLHDPAGRPYEPGFRKLLDELGSDTMRRRTNTTIAADTDGDLSRGEAVFRAYITDDLPAFESAYRRALPRLLGLTGS